MLFFLLLLEVFDLLLHHFDIVGGFLILLVQGECGLVVLESALPLLQGRVDNLTGRKRGRRLIRIRLLSRLESGFSLAKEGVPQVVVGVFLKILL